MSFRGLDGILSGVMSLNSNLHLDVEDVCQLPLFDKTLKLVSTKYGHPGLEQFTKLLQ
jgi:hypothetical protein